MEYQSLNFHCTRVALLSGVKKLFRNNKRIQKLFDPAVLHLVLEFAHFGVCTESIVSYKVTRTSKSGLGYAMIILEYMKRLKQGKYLVFPRMEDDYKNILSCLEWSISEIPFRREEHLVYLVLEYIHNVDRKHNDLIHPGNIFHVRKVLDTLFQDTESFLEAIFYLFRYPDWKANHKFIVEYMLNPFRKFYYFE